MANSYMSARRKYEEVSAKAATYDPDALFELAKMYENPAEGMPIEKDLDEALWYYCASVWEAHKLGKRYRASAFSAGRLLYKGTQSNIDTKSAYHYMMYAANAGHSTALEMLGCYHLGYAPMTQGCGYERIPVLGIKYINAAIEKGSVNAIFDLAMAYYEGNGVVRDEFVARDWFMKAGEKGHVGAMYNVGVISEKAVDYDIAGEWFDKAARGGDQQARKALQRYKQNKRTGKWDLS